MLRRGTVAIGLLVALVGAFVGWATPASAMGICRVGNPPLGAVCDFYRFSNDPETVRLRIEIFLDQAIVQGSATIPDSSSWFVDSIFYIEVCSPIGDRRLCRIPVPAPETVPFKTLQMQFTSGVFYKMCSRWNTSGGYSISGTACTPAVTAS